MSVSSPVESTPSDDIAPAQVLGKMMTGYWLTQALYTATKLGIPDLLTQGEQSIEALVKSTGAHEDFLYRVLRALSSNGIFEELEGRRFRLTPLATALRSDVPDSMRSRIIMMGEEHYVAWGKLYHSVKTGELPFHSAFGMGVFEYFEKHPEASETFNDAMTGYSQKIQAAVIAGYDFTDVKTLVDVGGGHGMLLSGVLKANPHLNGILFDLSHVAAGAAPMFEEAEVSDRVDIRSGDFFQEVPAGGDAYIMSHIIHDWSDELSTRILQNIHRAMAVGGRLLLVEFVVEPGNASPMAKMMDLNMLVMTPGGRERTEAEFRRLFDSSGFELTRLIPISEAHWVIEGKKR